MPWLIDWLARTQVTPAFARHGELTRAAALAIPGRPPYDRARPLQVMIFFGTGSAIRLDDAVKALVEGTPDPNLPPGVALHDLLTPSRLSAIEVLPRAWFADCTRYPEHGHYECLDGFAQLARWTRQRGRPHVTGRHDDFVSVLESSLPRPADA